jgi:Protein of unknown function (DUF3501)
MQLVANKSNKLRRPDLLPLERYATEREQFRAKVIAHKRMRKVALGDHVSLLFEDKLTVRYQVQEMLRIERIFEAAGIQEELDAYNPLIPDGHNLKATMLLEFPDAVVRAKRLGELAGIEHKIYAQVQGHARSFAHADEDLDRSTDDKTSAVHFLRFEFTPEAINALRDGAAMRMGIDDPRLPEQAALNPEQLRALVADFGLT